MLNRWEKHYKNCRTVSRDRSFKVLMWAKLTSSTNCFGFNWQEPMKRKCPGGRLIKLNPGVQGSCLSDYFASIEGHIQRRWASPRYEPVTSAAECHDAHSTFMIEQCIHWRKFWQAFRFKPSLESRGFITSHLRETSSEIPTALRW